MKEFLKELKKSRTLLLMLLPAVVIIFIFAYLPMGGMVLAFKQYNYRDGIWGSPWVENIFDNFKFFFMSGKAFAVTANTFSYNLCFIVVNTFLAVLNSSPTKPSLKSQVLIAYLGFSVCCGFGLAVFTVFAIWLSAKQS